ncbi:MAG: DUF6596 domain-containing protein [Streptosporangiaceae bacterium]
MRFPGEGCAPKSATPPGRCTDPSRGLRETPTTTDRPTTRARLLHLLAQTSLRRPPGTARGGDSQPASAGHRQPPNCLGFQAGSKAFLIPESTVGQRITRAKRKIADAGIPYRIPAADELGARLAEVLTVIYLLFNEGYLSSGGGQVQSRDLTDDAGFLAALLYQLMPAEPEVAGLLALIQLHRARAAARFDQDGELIQLPDRTGRGGTTRASPTPPG